MLFRSLKLWSQPLEFIRSWYAISWLIRRQSASTEPDLRIARHYHVVNEYQQLFRELRMVHTSFLIHFNVDPSKSVSFLSMNRCAVNSPMLCWNWNLIYVCTSLKNYLGVHCSVESLCKSSLVRYILAKLNLLVARAWCRQEVIFPGWTCWISGVVV